ncbi:MAG: hypothetical protein JWO87_854, partial [Phycisphaerales bacterium]|nr:hypothetical protein [Phycisphaerales bacterium]
TEPSTLLGGAGDDSITAGDGNDSIDGGAGNDSLQAGAGKDKVTGGVGNDTVVGGAGDDSLDGGAGNDSVVAGAGNDTVKGGTGDDSLQGGDGHCFLDGGRGRDHVGFTPAAGVPVSQVPTAVATGLTTLAQGATVTTVQVFKEDGQTYYGTVVSINGTDTRIVVDAKGNPVANGSDGQGEHQGGLDDHGGAFGSVVSVDAAANKITLKVTSEHAAAKQTTFTVASGATITVDGVATPLSGLPAGTWVAVQTSSADPTTATSITAFGRRVEGTVTAVDTTANTITLSRHGGGAATTYKVGASATITFNGASATLSAITVGSEALLKLSALDATTAISIDAASQSGNQGGGGDDHGGFGMHGGSFGSVVSTDTTAGSVTVNLRSEFGPPTQTTFTLAPGATVTVDGVAASLASLVAGEKISWTLSPTDSTKVTAIIAVGRRVEGLVSAIDTTAKTVTLQGHEGNGPQTFTLTDATVVTVSGAAGSLSGVSVGMFAELQLAAADATKVLTLSASALSVPPPDSHGGRDGH